MNGLSKILHITKVHPFTIQACTLCIIAEYIAVNNVDKNPTFHRTYISVKKKHEMNKYMNTIITGSDKCYDNNKTQQCGKVKSRRAYSDRVVKEVFYMIFELRYEQ